MGRRSRNVLELVSGWEAVELVLKCIVFGFWQFIQIVVKQLWKGHRRKSMKNTPPVQLTVTSIGTHCYIKIMGAKYHYVETGPKTGQTILVLGDAPDSGNLWGPNWTNVVRKLSEVGYHIITLDLRGTGGSEGGGRSDLSPPRAVEELAALMEALGVSENNPAVLIGFGVGGMLSWYLAHCHGRMISKFAVVGAPHPNLYWQYPPAAFCNRVLHFIQWPSLPEQWLAEGELQDGQGRWASSRACDWTGPLNYVRGAAWWRIRRNHRTESHGLLIGARDAAAQLVTSAQHCYTSTLRMVKKPDPSDSELANIILDFLIVKEKSLDGEPRTLVSRMLGAVAGRGREFMPKLVLPPAQT